jgi:hypothetical protein
VTIHGSVTDDAFAAFTAACPSITSLTMDDCRELLRIVVSSSRLSTVVMPRSRQLETLILHCPALTSLDITGCTHLRELVLDAPSLTDLKMEYCKETLFATLPEELRVRLQPKRGIRTDRGGIEAAVRPPAVQSTTGVMTEAASSDTTSNSTSSSTIEVNVLEWRIQRLTDLLADPAVTATARYGYQRQLQIQKAALARELRRNGPTE